MWIWIIFARDLLGTVIITVATNPYSLPPDFWELPLKFKWPAFTGHYTVIGQYKNYGNVESYNNYILL